MLIKNLNENVRYRLAISWSLLLCTALSFTLMASPVRASVPSPDQADEGSTFVGAGDIADCSVAPNPPKSTDTANLINDVLTNDISATVFTLGDNAYATGTSEEYNGCYHPTWGQFKSQTKPVPGNHEYYTTGAAGYYGYFGDAASPQETGCVSDCLGYYSYEVGAWHIVALNSEITHTAESQQITWLRNDLEAHKATACTLAYWHKPLFTSGLHQTDSDLSSHKAFWDVLYQYGVDVVLNGHDHEYERFAPQNPDGQADSAGIREFVVGTGGAALREFGTTQPNSEVRDNTAHGVLKLQLMATSYTWDFVPVAGQTFTDTGTTNCVERAPTPAETFFVGAGDIANCSGVSGTDGVTATAALIKEISGTVFALGDNAYNSGTTEEFADCYGPTWGQFKDRTKPVPGNHDYLTAGAAGYYGYFGSAASPQDTNCTSNCKGYYSYDLDGWHIVALNSEIDHSAASEQITWLKSDLAANQKVCTLAYWHRPLFTSGLHQIDGDRQDHKTFWDVLYQYGADVVLNGHDHEYERFAPQDPDGHLDNVTGIREFVVGTGGTELREFGTTQANSVVRDNTSHGVLKLQLKATSFTWEFVPVAGKSFTDSGTANCVETPAQPAPTLVGAGDIANCNTVEDSATGDLIRAMPDATVFALGDNAYASGTPEDYNNCYDPTWGTFKDRTKPVPGNHDYLTAGAAGYYGYFGAIATPQEPDCRSGCKGYYSYDLGGWHIIALNSEIDHSATSDQIAWLKSDLAANQKVCTMAYWHKPLFTSGLHQTDAERLSHKTFWDALYQYGADVVLNGHDHEYERFAPQNPSGQADILGIREFVVGMGGTGLREFGVTQLNSEVRNSTTHGVLKMRLKPTGYTWEFVPIAGKTFTDTGSGTCVGAVVFNNFVFLPLMLK